MMRIDDIRVARCQQRLGAGAVFVVGAELLRTRRLGRRTVRMAIRRMTGGETAVGREDGDSGAATLAAAQTIDANRAGVSRAPPAQPSRAP
jgi:hypothetical protein